MPEYLIIEGVKKRLKSTAFNTRISMLIGY